jgi:hypothetical protein
MRLGKNASREVQHSGMFILGKSLCIDINNIFIGAKIL